MKAALLIVLSLSALAFAGPAINKNQNQIDQQQQSQYMTTTGDLKQTQATEILKQWCFSSQMSQPELTSSFKKLVSIVKSSPEDQSTEAAVMSERICQGALVQKSDKTGETIAQGQADAKAHELIKDVYMDALIGCESRQCMQQLIKIINTNQVDTIRASYYMTRIAATEKDQIKDESEVKQLAESFIQQQQQPASEAVERQRLFAVTSLLGKQLEKEAEHGKQISGELKQIAEQVAKTIVERYIKPVSQQEVEQYKRQQPTGQQQQQQQSQVAKKIAKRSAALKALANIPGYVLKEIKVAQEAIKQLAENKQELSTVRQSAIECLEQNDQHQQQLKQITFDQEEPIEVRVAAYRALMTTPFSGANQQQQEKSEQAKQQMAGEIIEQVIKHCQEQRNQQQDDQFVLYAISHLENLRTSQQPEVQAIKETIEKNKQHGMQIQLLNKKFQHQLNDIRKSSRNYKLEQEFSQLESGLIVEGDLIYESKNKQQQQQQQQQILPKLIRVNMSMPVMGETVNVVEITLRQNQMDEELLSTLKLVQGAKFNSESMSKVVDSFKSSVEQRNPTNKQQQQTAEADLTIKVEGQTIVYLCVDDFKSAITTGKTHQGQRNTRSVYGSSSIVDEVIEFLRRQPVAFNRGFNFSLNKQLAKVLDVDANIIAGLRFESRASGQSSKDFEIVAQVEPRFAFEAIVGPAKMSAKKLLQRVSTKSALGLRLRFKEEELVDVQIDLPMNTMELFTFETQMVEKSATTPYSYTYLPESIYGQEDIYSWSQEQEQEAEYSPEGGRYATAGAGFRGLRKMKRSIFESSDSNKSIVKKIMSTGIGAGNKSSWKQGFVQELETPVEWARATGLRSKVRVVASPKDMTFVVQCVAQKYEPRMQGYRVQVQQAKRGSDLQQFVFTISTPGSAIDRTMQVRLVKQVNQQRFALKADVQSPLVAASAQAELLHDGRQYAVKAELATSRVQGAQKQWRHKFEAGVQRASQSASGRVATAYKPYLSVDSTSLKRPVQMQGVVSFQAGPKSVISYELKCPTSGDFVQGKIIVDQQQQQNVESSRRQSGRRSMQSPLESLLRNDLTLTQEFVAQVEEHAVKVHQMIEWEASKWAVQADLQATHKNLRKQQQPERQLQAKLQLDKDEQMLTVQRRCPQQEAKEFRLAVQSSTKQPGAHQLAADFRYSGKRAQPQTLVYKHKLDYSGKPWRQCELGYAVELQASELQLSEKLQGRTHFQWEPKMKSVRAEIANQQQDKRAKLAIEFQSLEQHQIEMSLQTPKSQHKTEVRADKRQFSLQSRTSQRGQMIAKLVVEVAKQQGECQLIVEMPTKKTHMAVDLKLAPGKLSSVAIQCPGFAGKSEFVFECGQSGARHYIPALAYRKSPIAGLRFKSDLKDLVKQEQYWIESNFNNAPYQADKQSYLRLGSPAYRTDLEFSPREQSAKWGVFARSKRSVGYPYEQQQQQQQETSYLSGPFGTNNNNNKIELGNNKLWMIRSLVQSPSGVDQLKREARRALFEYADRRQQQKHSLHYQPAEERVKYAFERQPSGFSQQVQPMSIAADFSTDIVNPFAYTTAYTAATTTDKYSTKRPSTLSMDSQWMDLDFEAQPFDGEEGYAKLSALSRSARSAPFKKHDSEIRYNKKHGYKAYVKHMDADERRHQWQLEADKDPKKWAKMSFESDKHGKGQYEHQWRKHQAKRASKHAGEQDQEDIYQNRVAFKGESPNNRWAHSSQLAWDEPIRHMSRQRRSIDSERFGLVDYLRHTSGRLQSQTSRDQSDLYKLDFDYQPQQQQFARLSIDMPEEMQHLSSFEYQPSERLYKLSSKLYNRRSQQPSYELMAATKPIIMGEQESVFYADQHPYVAAAATGTGSTFATLFKQPLKLDYTDKYGRVASLDYDYSPIGVPTVGQKYSGLRLKRAALLLKDQAADFKHESTFDFYPEAVFAFPSTKRQHGDIQVRAETKYGPVVVHVDADENTSQLVLKSPIFNAQLSAQTPTSGPKRSQLIKLTVDNRQQSVKLAKIVRQTPVIGEIELVKELAQSIDKSRFEHQTELLVSMVESIMKLKSETSMDKRQVMVVEGEISPAQNKAYFKVNGERVQGQLVVDLATKAAQLAFDVDNKHTLEHQTRLVRISDKFFSLDSVTSHKQQPLFKLSGKVSSMIFSEPEHLFSSRRQSSSSSSGLSREEHISTFEAIVYEPKEMHVAAQYDCLKKEARVVVNNQEDKKVTSVRVKYDDRTEDVHVEARSTNKRGASYQIQKTINLTPYVKVY